MYFMFDTSFQFRYKVGQSYETKNECLLRWTSGLGFICQDAVVLRRLRIGHTRLTHSYLLNRQDQPECSHCDCALTVAHDRNHYNVVRQRYFSVSSLHELFDSVNAKIFLVLLEMLGFIVSCNLNFNHLIDLITVIIFKPIVNT